MKQLLVFSFFLIVSAIAHGQVDATKYKAYDQVTPLTADEQGIFTISEKVQIKDFAAKDQPFPLAFNEINQVLVKIKNDKVKTPSAVLVVKQESYPKVTLNIEQKNLLEIVDAVCQEVDWRWSIKGENIVIQPLPKQ